ncbi:Asp/Glu/hydantoin racemase [Rhizobium sp. BK376]|uniref:maleate cis-trans isomerase family protein n=1 Tax=Rhizobium sp. BK376 TaxID=2512149 RepID=UPI0010D2A9B8|nr:Asp/Glu/hydantoin racemase [Rhizobium sp. BK376]TCR68173.1 maleate isomerase [Rhizobium sp. BK376]
MNPLRIGMLTPSSNTVLEPVTTQMLKDLPDVTAHFSRFRVTAIGLDAALLNQFDDRPMMTAAELLADAKVDVVVWNGTSAGWLGLDSDRRLCERITQVTGIKASTSVLALFDVMRKRNEHRIGLATPYTSDVQAAIIKSFASEGVEVICERHQGIRDNFSFSQVRPETIAEMIADLAPARPNSVAIFCTNLAGAPLVNQLEAAHGIAIHDSVATSIYGALAALDYDLKRVQGFGRMFSGAS